MKDVITKLREREQAYLEKAETLAQAIEVLLDGDPEFDVTKNLEGAGLPKKAETRMKVSSLKISKQASLRNVVLASISVGKSITASGLAERLREGFPQEYGRRASASLRASIADVLLSFRTTEEIKNLGWRKAGSAYVYWFNEER